MNDHTLKVLDFRETLFRLAQHAHSEPGRILAKAILPRREKKDVLRECRVTSEALRFLEDHHVDLGMVTDTAAILERLAVAGTVLEPLELLSLALNQQAVRHLRSALRGKEAEMPSLEGLIREMGGFPDWEHHVERSISSKGEVLDAASPGLAGARKELSDCRNAAKGKLEEFLRKRGVAKVVQEQYVTLRNGRFVVPARPEYHRTFEGVVQDTSQSGQTVFVEPLFAVPLNNRYTVALAEEEEEIRRALAVMSAEAAAFRHQMAANLERLSEVDMIFARARFGSRLNGIIPGFDEQETVLVDARHPHLVLEPGSSCVPIDIRIGGSSTTLVITGPNTGGKTVALKTLGLLSLMAQSGMPVPVSEESRFKIFTSVFADIGDEQSLNQNLSTFSGHMRIIAGLLDDADTGTLVLLDELGAGTDPQEGSALSIALLESLHEKGACAVVTTHHNLLKEFAYRATFAGNASTVFDAGTLEPTYRLRMGAPGRSHALEVARGLGIDDGIIRRAKEVMGSGAVQVDELLGRLTEEVDRESLARERAEEITRALEAERQSLRRERAELKLEAQRMRETARREARSVLRDIERKGRQILKTLRKEEGKLARSLLADGVREMDEKVRETFPPPPPRKGRGPIAAGLEVEVLSLGLSGTVVKLLAGGREAEVLSGRLRMRVLLEDLAPAAETGVAEAGTGTSGVSYTGGDEAPFEINLIGKKVEEALTSLEKALDRSVVGSGKVLRVVHGKGTGALKKAVGEALSSDPRVSAFGPAPLNEGGAGVTIVELKE